MTDLARGFMLLVIALANSHYFLRGPSILGGPSVSGSPRVPSTRRRI
jgi:hypothetical protein